MSPCEAHVLRVGIFLEEGRETQKIPMNYVPRIASKQKFHGKYLTYSVYLMPMFSVFVRESL